MFRNIFFAGLVVALSCHGISGFSPAAGLSQRTDVKMSAEVDRRTMLANAAAIAAGIAMSPAVASALNSIPADNEIVKEQRTVVNRLDVNNAPVADYMRLPGMYPAIGGKIANNGPFNSVKDVYKIKGLSAEEKTTIKKYEKVLTATEASGLDPMRGRDPYRTSFNQFATVKSE